MGPIATEVVQGLKEGPPVPVQFHEPVPVRPSSPVPIIQEPGSDPISTTVKNLPRVGSPAWWFQQTGPTGIICMLATVAFYATNDSMKESQKAIINQMQKGEENRNAEARRVIDGVLSGQNETIKQIDKLDRTLEKLSNKLDKIGPNK